MITTIIEHCGNHFHHPDRTGYHKNQAGFMKWYPLTTAQIIILIFLITVADIYTIMQRLVFPELLRLFIYLFFLVFSLLAFFLVVKPDEPMVLAKTLSVVLFIATLILILIQDVIAAQTVSWRTGILLLGAVVAPVAAGYGYTVIYTRHRE